MVVNQVSVDSYYANIYVGRRAGYGHTIHVDEKIIDFIEKYVNEIGLCVTFTRTEFIYKDGKEPGYIIGLINYPRFPKSKEEIQNTALDLSKKLLTKMEQNRITILFPDKTIMLEKGENCL